MLLKGRNKACTFAPSLIKQMRIQQARALEIIHKQQMYQVSRLFILKTIAS